MIPRPIIASTSVLARIATAVALGAVAVSIQVRAEEIPISIGTQNTTINTVTAGVVLKELKLLEKHLPRTGKFRDRTYKIEWQNFTSGPPITNGMIANRIHIGAMGDYPLLVNGATGQQQKGQESQLIAVVAYNMLGAGNGVVVHRDSPYFDLADLKGKSVSVPFGSAAHGMLLQTMQERGWPQDFWALSNQSPEVGTTSLQEKRIDGHANFVPFAELLPFRGYARKIFDGVQTRVPTFHGVVVRKDFGEKHPEIVVAFIRAMMEANEWVRRNPMLAAERIAEWTRIEKEVIYIFLGPGGIHALDPTIKPQLVDAIRTARGVLQRLNRLKVLNTEAWVNDAYVRGAFREQRLDYDAQLKSLANYEVAGKDSFCGVPIKQPRRAGEVWMASGEILPFSSPDCTLGAMRRFNTEGRKYSVAYLYDQSLGIKVFAEQAFYATEGAGKPRIVPFLLKKDAEAHALKSGGKVVTLADALKLTPRDK
jgi:NitT/TauT family transport system substrate-binding protein